MNNKNKLICIGIFVLYSILGFSQKQVKGGKGSDTAVINPINSDKDNNAINASQIAQKDAIILAKDSVINQLSKSIKALDDSIKKLQVKPKNKEAEKISDKSDAGWADTLLLLVLFAAGFILLVNMSMRYKIIDKIIDKIKDYFNDVEELEQVKTIDFDVSKNIPAKGIVVEDAINLKPIQKSDKVLPFKKENTNSTWLVLGQSVMGKSHIQNNIPCQDNHFIEDFGNNWGIAIACDGAGSAINSQIGSKFVSQHATKVFRAIVEQNNFLKQNSLPTKGIWKDLAKRGLYQVYKDLDDYSKKEGFRIESCACTVIIVIYSPFGYLVTHIGDGRAGYLNEQNEWKALLTPWKGEEANQTVFITSSIWNEKIDDFIKSDVIETEPRAFTLMSDGCENHSFECSKMNPETKEWSDPNLPFPKFFNPLMGYLVKSKKDGKSDDEINTEWSKFILEGTPGLKNESDDKTLILGILQLIE